MNGSILLGMYVIGSTCVSITNNTSAHTLTRWYSLRVQADYANIITHEPRSRLDQEKTVEAGTRSKFGVDLGFVYIREFFHVSELTV